MAESHRISTEEIRQILRKKYPPPEYAFLEEVRNQTGYQKRVERYADAVAVNLWPSRGLEVLGFEIKARRSDWTKELSDPAKSAEIQQYCDRWWIIAGGRNVVHPGELPPTWGLLVVHGNGGKRRLVCTQEAPKLDAKPLDKAFLLAMLRRSVEAVTAARDVTQTEAYKKGLEAGRAALEADRKWEGTQAEHDLKMLRQAVKQFEEASGIELTERRAWQWEDIGVAVRVVLQHLRKPNGHRQALKDAMAPLRACLGAMQALDHTFDLLEEKAMGRKG